MMVNDYYEDYEDYNLLESYNDFNPKNDNKTDMIVFKNIQVNNISSLTAKNRNDSVCVPDLTT